MTRLITKIKERLAGEGGFTLIETIAAIGILFVSMMALAYTSLVGFKEIAIARQRQTANQVANQILERVRGLPYATIGQGLASGDLSGDPNVVSCSDGLVYFRVCPGVDPSAEQIVHTDGLPPTDPLVPHAGVVGPPSYTLTYSWWVYVTKATGVPQSGAYRVRAIVAWTSPERAGAAMGVQGETLIYHPEGSTDPGTAPVPGSDPFFYGEGNLAPGAITVKPLSGVTGGIGVRGLSTWDSMTRDLTFLSANLQSERLTRSDGQVVLHGASKTVGGVITRAGAARADSTADDDPATPPVTGSFPGSPVQAPFSVDVTGGGNSIQMVATGATLGCPGVNLNPSFMTGFEHGVGSSDQRGILDAVSGTAFVESSVRRSGTYSMRVQSGASFRKDVAASTVVLRFALRLSALPAGDSNLVTVAVNSGNNAVFGYKASEQRFFVRYGSDVYATSTVLVGAWYVIDMKVNLGASPRTIDWRIDDTAQPVASQVANATTARSVTWSMTSSGTPRVNYDDLMVSTSAAEYPIGNGEILALRPDGMGASAPASVMKENGTTVIGATAWTRVDDVPMFPSGDYVSQTAINSSAYAEMTLGDTASTCIRAVNGIMTYESDSSSINHGKTILVDGGSERTLYDGDMSDTTQKFRSSVIAPASSPWTQAALNGLKVRVGYSTDVSPKNPEWHSLLVEYESHIDSGAATTGPQTGFTRATVPDSPPSSCFPTQTSGSCAYTTERHGSSPPAYDLLVNLSGSGAGSCVLYDHRPVAGATSYVYARRGPGTGGAGIVAEDAVRYYGQHTLGQLCAGTVNTTPDGWPGYLVRYDAGASPACAKAQAGIGAAHPEVCSVGTITYWNGSGTSTMTPPVAGGTIPVAPFTHSNAGWLYEITGSLSVAPSVVEQDPSSAPIPGTADRKQARAVFGAPLTGTFNYKLSSNNGSIVYVNVTVAVDIGGLTARARYQV